MGLRAGGERKADGGGGAVRQAGFSQGYGNKVELCFVCWPLRIPMQN